MTKLKFHLTVEKVRMRLKYCIRYLTLFIFVTPKCCSGVLWSLLEILVLIVCQLCSSEEMVLFQPCGAGDSQGNLRSPWVTLCSAQGPSRPVMLEC